VVYDPPDASFTYLANALTVTFTNTSSNGSSCTWDFGDGNTSQLTDPTHTYASSGTYTVTLISMNACGADTSVTTITVTTGIAENSGDPGFAIYPNPTDGLFNIDIWGSPAENRINYSIYDMIGNSVRSGNFVSVNGKSHAVLDMSGVSRGVYMIRLYNDSMNNAFKIILK